MSKNSYRNIPLPAGWPKHVRSAVIHAISLAATALTATRAWAADHRNSRVRMRAEFERLEQELALIREELRIKDARLSQIPARQRPHYPPVERLAILALRAARGWSAREAAARFQLSHATLSKWNCRLDEKGPDALVQSPVPLNKYSDVVARIVQQLKVVCPSFGYGRIANVLGREGLRLGTSTVKRLIRRTVAPEPRPEPERASPREPRTNVAARHPHHAWHCDLTPVPTSIGFWSSTLPFGLPQRWPFCWSLVVLADQFSARILRLAIFRNPPTTEQVLAVVTRAVDEGGVAPTFLITDKGPQFRDRVFRRACRRRGIRHRSGSLGQFGSIPFIERLILTIKKECTTRILVPYSLSAARKELALFKIWYNRVRPHERLRGATPDEVYRGVEPASTRAPRAPGNHGVVRVVYLEGRRHLPVVTLDRAA